MTTHKNDRTIKALDNVMEEMQHLVDHPRMQQRNWVAKGKEWLPVLQHAKEDLQRDVDHNDFVVDAYQGVLEAIKAIGLTIEKRDATSWGYRWHDDQLTGA
ncbi:MAG: hypothetical protein WBC91_17775, partial [Phototrophicaceae bacterium]